MDWLKDFLNGLAQWLLTELGKLINNLASTLSWLFASFIAFCVMPITWVIDSATYYLGYVVESVQWIGSEVDRLGFDDVGGMWNSMGPYLNLANTVFPIDKVFWCVGILVALRVLALVVRVIIRLVPTMG